MERWYNVRFEFKDPQLQNLHFTGTLENETIQQALDYMNISSPFLYTMQGNIIYIGK